MKLKALLGIVLIAVIMISCSDERPAKIEKIKTNTELSKADKILKIADIALNNLVGDSVSFEIQKDDDGNDFLYVKVSDPDFVYSSNEQMQTVVKSYIAKYIWRFLHDTKDLGINHIGIEYYGNVSSDEGRIDALIYQVYGVRSDLESIKGFYDISPYETGEYDVVEPGSEQDKIIDEIISKMQFLTNNGDQIEF